MLKLKPQSRSHVVVLRLVLRLLFAEKFLKGAPDPLKNAALLIWTVFPVGLCEMDVMVKVLVRLMTVFCVAEPDSQSLVISGRAHAGDSRGVPLAVGPAAYRGGVPLDEALITVIPDQRVDLIAGLQGSEYTGLLYHWRLTARHCSFLACECEVVVAGHVVPLPSFMPDHYHTVLSRLEKAVWLIGPPVVILHWSAISPPEVSLKHPVVQAYPLVITAQLVYKTLFFVGQNAGEVGAMDSTLSFSRVPSSTVSEVFVAMRLELLPTKSTHLSVLLTEFPGITGQAEAGEGADPVQTGGSIQTRVGLALIDICFTALSSVSRCTHTEGF